MTFLYDNQKKLLSLFIIGLLFGCGGGSSGASTASPEDSYTFSVERGPILGAVIKDNNGRVATSLGNGQYRFNTAPEFPITTFGGYIDINRNGIVDSTDKKMDFSLKGQNGASAITLVGSILANTLSTKEYLVENFSLSEEAIMEGTPLEDRRIGILSNLIFEYLLEQNKELGDVDENVLGGLLNDFNTQLNIALALSEEEYLEYLINTESTIAASMDVLDATELAEANIIIEELNDVFYKGEGVDLLDALPVNLLSESQIDGLLFMYEEEKLARDVYLKFYEMYGSNIFINIANAESTHMTSIATLLDKYDIPYTTLDEGNYGNQTLQALYENLLERGTTYTEALQVGADIEILDISDLEEAIIGAPEDLAIVYSSLKNGSENHLNAFTRLAD